MVLAIGLGIASQSPAAITPSTAVSGCLKPVLAGVDQVAPGVLQFWMELAAPPVMDPDPDHWTTYIWFVDTDCNPRTGQPHATVGSEYNIRAVIRNHAAHGGGFIDGIDRPGGVAPMLVDGTRVIVRVTLDQIGNPTRFIWGCGALTWNGAHEESPPPRTFRTGGAANGGGAPARVVVELPPSRTRTVSLAPTIRALGATGAPLSVEGRSVKLFAYRGLVRIASTQVNVPPDRVGLEKVTAMVDGVLSCNVARVMLGSVEIVPSAMHLQWPARTVGKVSFRVIGADGTAISMEDHQLAFTIDDNKVAALSEDGTVEARPAGAGRTTYIRGEFDGTPATNHCDVRVLNYPVHVNRPWSRPESLGELSAPSCSCII